jgi:hypothetical protein
VLLSGVSGLDIGDEENSEGRGYDDDDRVEEAES